MADARERKFPAVPAIFGGGRVLPSPSQFYLTGEDRLRVVSANTLVGCALKVQLRTADIAGEIHAQSYDHVPTSNRSVRRLDYPVGEGSILNVTVFAGTGAPRIGQTYVMVQLVRGFDDAAVVLGTLLAGYVTNTQALGFPGSPIQSSIEGGGYYRGIVGTVPAVGAHWNEVVPTGARWQLNALVTQFTADATVAARSVGIQWQTGGQQVGSSTGISTINASGQGTYTFLQGMPLASAVQPGANVQGLGNDMTLMAGDAIFSVAANMQAGDRWNYVNYAVREWLEVQ